MIQKTYKIRSVLIFLLLLCVYAVILFNLYYIQIHQRHFYLRLADQQHHITVTIQPPRGIIYDRNRKPFVLNKESFSAFIIPNNIKSPETLKSFLSSTFPGAVERLEKNKQNSFMYVKRRLTDQQLDLIKKSNIVDIYILQEAARWYPDFASGHIIGITDIDNHGSFGIELIANDLLSGLPTTYQLEKDARSGFFYIQKNTKIEGQNAQSIQLTIDSTIQFLVADAVKEMVNSFSAKEGASIIMNPTNGEILAMVQYPAFDPNDVEELVLDHTKNKLVTDVYELGSVMKVFTALAGFAEGIVQADELIDCGNTKLAIIDGFPISTWKAYGLIPFSEVIQHSNNIGIATVAKRLQTKLYDHYKRLGFGKKTALHWPAEQAGFVTPPKQWSRQSIISLSFGYEITANLLQLARAFGMIANKGIMVEPTLIVKNNQQIMSEKIYPEDVIEIIRDILKKTAEPIAKRIAQTQEFIIMGKTGTANMVVDGQYSKEHNTYTFAGIIEKDNYKRIIITFIKDVPNNKNLYASTVAAPLFEKIVEILLVHDKMI